MPRKLYFSVTGEAKVRGRERERKPNVNVASLENQTSHGNDIQLPMLSVTVMMLRLIVESVMLLKDDDWQGGERRIRKHGIDRYMLPVERV